MPERPGILPRQAIAALVAKGAIKLAAPAAAGQIQPASLDLRLGAEAYRIRASFLPKPGVPVAKRLDELVLHSFKLGDGAVLETGCVYLVPLQESLALPPDLSATANPKSSTGRLDVFTRVIADGVPAFDQLAGRLHGKTLRGNLPTDLSRRRARGFAPQPNPLPPRSAAGGGCKNSRSFRGPCFDR